MKEFIDRIPSYESIKTIDDFKEVLLFVELLSALDLINQDTLCLIWNVFSLDEYEREKNFQFDRCIYDWLLDTIRMDFREDKVNETSIKEFEELMVLIENPSVKKMFYDGLYVSKFDTFKVYLNVKYSNQHLYYLHQNEDDGFDLQIMQINPKMSVIHEIQGVLGFYLNRKKSEIYIEFYRNHRNSGIYDLHLNELEIVSYPYPSYFVNDSFIVVNKDENLYKIKMDDHSLEFIEKVHPLSYTLRSNTLYRCPSNYDCQISMYPIYIDEKKSEQRVYNDDFLAGFIWSHIRFTLFSVKLTYSPMTRYDLISEVYDLRKSLFTLTMTSMREEIAVYLDKNYRNSEIKLIESLFNSLKKCGFSENDNLTHVLYNLWALQRMVSKSYERFPNESFCLYFEKLIEENPSIDFKDLLSHDIENVVDEDKKAFILSEMDKQRVKKIAPHNFYLYQIGTFGFVDSQWIVHKEYMGESKIDTIYLMPKCDDLKGKVYFNRHQACYIVEWYENDQMIFDRVVDEFSLKYQMFKVKFVVSKNE
ncbi:MAG: hypothetical protein ACI4U3_07980 [Traorella sp.]